MCERLRRGSRNSCNVNAPNALHCLVWGFPFFNEYSKHEASQLPWKHSLVLFLGFVWVTVNKTSWLPRFTNIWYKLWNSRDCDIHYHFYVCYGWPCWDFIKQHSQKEAKYLCSLTLYIYGTKQNAICAFSSQFVWRVRIHTSLALLLMRTVTDVNFIEKTCLSLGMCGITAA